VTPKRLELLIGDCVGHATPDAMARRVVTDEPFGVIDADIARVERWSFGRVFAQRRIRCLIWALVGRVPGPCCGERTSTRI
jgi:hypothetical protein